MKRLKCKKCGGVMFRYKYGVTTSSIPSKSYDIYECIRCKTENTVPQPTHEGNNDPQEVKYKEEI